jgi:hypothetical protein
LFGWASTNLIQKTFVHTTQHAHLPDSTMLKKAFNSPSPALNVYHHQEDVACDTVYSDVPAIYDGANAAVKFVGITTQMIDVYGIKCDNRFVNTLEINIIQKGVPNKLISDRGQSIVSYKVKDILLFFVPYVLATGKVNHTNSTRTLLNGVIKPSRIIPIEFLTILVPLIIPGYYVLNTCVLSLNHMQNSTINVVPLTQLSSGSTVDISVLLRFHFWKPDYYKISESSFPSESKEVLVTLLVFLSIVVMPLPILFFTHKSYTIIYHIPHPTMCHFCGQCQCACGHAWRGG